jgi:hypothetical protein
MMKALFALVEYAVELDTGKHTEGVASTILFVIRLLIRIEGFVSFLINFHKAKLSGGNIDTLHELEGSLKDVRGLETTEDLIKELSARRSDMRVALLETMFPMLERWLEVITSTGGDNRVACVIHAHLAYLYIHTPYSELTRQSIITILNAQIFLTGNYQSDPGQEGKKKKKKDDDTPFSLLSREEEWGIAETDVFYMFQKQRANVLHWLEQNHSERNEVMEAVVRLTTATGGRVRPEGVKCRHWQHIDGRHCLGRFIPAPKVRTKEELAEVERVRDTTPPDQVRAFKFEPWLASLVKSACC